MNYVDADHWDGDPELDLDYPYPYEHEVGEFEPLLKQIAAAGSESRFWERNRP